MQRLLEIFYVFVYGASSLMFCLMPPYRLEGSFYEVMQVEFEMDNIINLQSTQTIRWQIEYPSTGTQAEAVSHLYISQRDIQGIVPLAEVKGN